MEENVNENLIYIFLIISKIIIQYLILFKILKISLRLDS
jgi:hypothetical protein